MTYFFADDCSEYASNIKPVRIGFGKDKNGNDCYFTELPNGKIEVSRLDGPTEAEHEVPRVELIDKLSTWEVAGDPDYLVELPKGTIEKIFGRGLTLFDDPLVYNC